MRKPKPNERPIDLFEEAKKTVATISTNGNDIETLANIMKKISDTQQSIVSNMK